MSNQVVGYACCGVSGFGLVSWNGLPKTSGSAALMPICFQTDVVELNQQAVAESKERRRQIGPVQQAIDDLASMPDNLAGHMDHLVQKCPKLHGQ